MCNDKRGNYLIKTYLVDYNLLFVSPKSTKDASSLKLMTLYHPNVPSQNYIHFRKTIPIVSQDYTQVQFSINIHTIIQGLCDRVIPFQSCTGLTDIQIHQ